LWFLATQSLIVTLLVAGPLLAAALLIHARLLGRLAWAVGRD
jgi:hypothetical protein